MSTRCSVVQEPIGVEAGVGRSGTVLCIAVQSG